MMKKPATENERLLSSVLLVFIVYFGLNSLIFAVFEENSVFVHRLMTLSFLGGMLAGVAFFLWSKPPANEKTATSPMNRNIEILKRALSDDEKLLIDIIRNSEGITQDSIRFRTGFSKSKVSALISEMEKKDIVVRERLGRTYKVSISDWIKK
jgi:uncharacterized membrane protein